MADAVRREREPRNPKEILISTPSSEGEQPDEEAAPDYSTLCWDATDDADARPVYAVIYRKHAQGGHGRSDSTDHQIRFVPPEMTGRSVYDILTETTLRSHAIDDATYESIPTWAQLQLHRNGHVKVSGSFNPETSEFDDFRTGWGVDKMNQADVLYELVHELGSENFVAAVYYFLHTHASDANASPEAIAEIRDIQPASVQNRIREVQNTLSSPREQ